jgi:hypothetical protein
MKVLIAGAAALVASSLGASAADLAKRAPVAVDYVKVCDAYGEGFFYIPGTETCLKIGGYVRFDITGGRDDFDIFSRGGNHYNTLARLQLQVDARSQTSFGVLRSFAAMNFNKNSSTSPDGENTFEVDQAYIQWGGLTAGKAQSFFDFFTGYAPAVNYGELVHDDKVNLLAYTFGFAGGLTATISLEDATQAGRQEADLGASGVYGGNRVPDIVGNLKLEQGWGTAQVMAVAHNVYGYTELDSVDKWGFAVGAGLTLKLPAFGADDEFGIQAAYADGAIRYLGFNLPWAYDFDYVNAARSTGWGVFAGLKHGFTPTLAGILQGGYISVDADYNPNDLDLWDVSAALTWTPVTNLEITPFVEYRSAKTDELGKQTGWTGGLRLQRNF